MKFKAMGRIFARLIHNGDKKLSDFNHIFHEAIKAGYLELYFEECPNE